MIRSYLKIAWRNLARNKTYSLINIVGLAAGTLCCLYILLYVEDQYGYDKQHSRVQDIYRVNTLWTVQEDKANWGTVTAPVAPAMKKDFPEVEQFARIVPAIGIDHHLLHYKDKSLYEKDAVYADSTLFQIFSFHFSKGNPQTALSAPYSVVLLQPTAAKLFGTEDPIGKTIQIENNFGKNNFLVTGVADESAGKSHIHANMFMSMNSGGYGSFVYHNNSWAGNNIAISYVQLKPHTDIAALQKKLPAFLNKYGGEELMQLGMAKEFSLQPLRSIHTSPGFRGIELTKPADPQFLYILMLIAILIQTIACINFMNLSTARASKRAKEVGVRKVIGARRNDLIKQFLGESFLLSFIAVFIALPLLVLLLPYLNQLTHADVHLDLLSDYRLWIILAAMLMITGVVAGSYPAFYLSAFRAIKVIKGNFTNHISVSGIRKSLVVFQFALSIVLIAAIVIIYSQLNFIKNKNLGFEKDQKIVFSFHTEDAVNKIPAFMGDLKQLAGIKTVSRTNNYPGQPVLYDLHLFLAGGNIATAPDASFIQADEFFINATGIKLLAGHDFRKNDSGKVIINESLAKKLGLQPMQAPGTIVHSQSGNGNLLHFEIAGVMKDYNYSSLREEVKPLFLMYDPAAGSEIIASTGSKNYKALLDKISVAWNNNFAGLPFEYGFVDDAVQKQYEAENTLSGIINAFTLMAIFISSMGLFGLAAFSAEQRSKEIGIRKVLGASVAGIVQLLSKEFIRLIAIAFVIAVPVIMFTMNKWLQAFSYRVSISWWMLALAGMLTVFIALITVGFQAIKAGMANPVKSLRSE